MAMSKQDYADLGRTNAQQRFDPEKLEAPHPFDHGAVSWQAKAYWGAFDDEMFRLGQAKKADQKLDSESQTGGLVVDSMTLIEPKAKGDGDARAEHLRQLIRALNHDDLNQNRYFRLVNKITAIKKRMGTSFAPRL